MRENMIESRKAAHYLTRLHSQRYRYASVITVKNLACLRPEGDPIFVNVNFNVNEGDIIICGHVVALGELRILPTYLILIIVVFLRKTTLLKCLAHLNLYHGTIELRGK